MIERESNDGILTLRLAHGKASALDLELCRALQQEMEKADGPVVLTGTGSIFSAGVDLPRMLNEGGRYVHDFLEAFEGMLHALFYYPRPVVAAANGHAIAGGAILTFACDYKLMCGGRVGVPEALVGVPFPRLALEICRFAVPRQHLQPMIYLARTVEMAEAKSMGIIDEIVAPENLGSRALEVARQLGNIPAETFRATKRQLREGKTADIEPLWSSPEIHQHIRQYLEKTLRKR